MGGPVGGSAAEIWVAAYRAGLERGAEIVEACAYREDLVVERELLRVAADILAEARK